MPVHPLIQRVIRRAYQNGHGSLPFLSVEKVREYYRTHYFTTMHSISYHEIKVGYATLRFHFPYEEKKRKLPLIIYLRGSGYVVGEIGDTDLFCHLLAKELKCAVVAIEPRLAPESKFPDPFDDLLNSILFLYQEHETLGLLPQHFALWGESSGGNFAAALSNHFGLINKNIIRCQVLFYPMLDYVSEYPSISQFKEGYLMDRALCDWFVAQHVQSWEERFDPRISPLRGAIQKPYPSTLIVGAKYDPMRDESFAYIEKLSRAEIPVEAVFFPGLIHGFLLYATKLEEAFDAQCLAVNYLRRNLL